MIKIAVILGSTCPKYRLGERVATWVMSQASVYPEIEFTYLDVRDYNLPFFNEEQGPRGNKDRRPEPHVQKWLADLSKADGYIILTAEYNSAPTASLKNSLDFIAFEMQRKAVGLVGYSDGSNGGMYAPLHLRPILSELEVVVIPPEHIILQADKVITEDGVALTENKDSLDRRFARLMKQLIWYTKALKIAREQKDY